MKTPVRYTLGFGFLLNLLLPGAGHVLWREVMFGLFVFLVMVLAAALFLVHYLIPMPKAATWILLGLPVLFYLFTFVDLRQTIRSKRPKSPPSRRVALVALAVGLLYQLFAPSAVCNFGIRNFPEIFRVDGSHLSPVYANGDITVANRLAYAVDVPFARRPILHSLPERFDLVRFEDSTGRRQAGAVIGLPNESVVIRGGQLEINQVPTSASLPRGMKISGDWPEVTVQGYSVIIATFNLGTVDHLWHVRLDRVVGRIKQAAT